ncbi:MAG: dipeptidase, partial [Phycisphaerales bacterium]|nr:dipeptidase [Phycisphaerales bacterium]
MEKPAKLHRGGYIKRVHHPESFDPPIVITMPSMNDSYEDSLERALALHRRAVVIDSHCDTTQRLLDPHWDFAARHADWHVDIPRLRDGGVDALVLAVYAPQPAEPDLGVAAARAQLDRIHETVRRDRDSLTLARSADDVRRAKRDGRIAVLIAIEGGYLIADSLDVLREFRQRGAIYMTLTHAFHTTWADSSGVHEPLAPLHGGLTDFGREVVREMNHIGMIVDVSHVSDATFGDVLETSSAPPIASHSSCRAVSPHRRNLSDDMIRALAERGGVVQINFAAAFVDPDFPQLDPKPANDWWERGGFAHGPLTDHVTPLDVLVNHFDHALRLVGPDHVGIGSDFDGVGALPKGM